MSNKWLSWLAGGHRRRARALRVKPERRICVPYNYEQGYDQSSFPTFGPSYHLRKEDPAWRTLKDEAWQLVATRSGGDASKSYIEAIQGVENKAREAYDEPFDDLDSFDFALMMMKDGCFMLQVALLALGGSKQFQDPQQVQLIGKYWKKEYTKRLITSMFVVGNQIPLVVLKELLKQSFFQTLLSTRQWSKRPMDLQERTLFEFLVAPMLDSRSKRNAIYPLLGLNPRMHQQEPSDLLHGLWMLLIGQPYNSDDDDEDDDDDDGDSACLMAIRSATELHEAGIFFKDNRGTGTRGIRFKKNMFNAVVTLPSISVDANTKVLFYNLIHYEISQELEESQREVCAYLRFMQELIRTPDDVKLLARNGIIRANPKHETEFPEILRELPVPETKSSRNLRLAELQIYSYSQPSKYAKLRSLLSAVLLLTVLQTVYSILSYYNN